MQFLKQAVTGAATRNKCARAVVAGDLHLLNANDRTRTAKHLLPLFDWQAHPKDAQQVWDGYLVSGQMDSIIVETLLPHYLQAAKQYGPGQRRERVCEHLAVIALHSPVGTPEPDGWLDQFTAEFDADIRASWAGHLGRYLKEAGTGIADGAWDRWIGKYWQRRVDGIPRPLEKQEGTEMLAWVAAFGERRSDAIDLMVQTPVQITRSWALDGFLKPEVLSSSPKPLAKLLAHVLAMTSPAGFYLQGELKGAVATLEASGELTVEELRPICEQALKFGCTDAGEWLSSQRR
jgi:hypothetical protein